MRVGTWGVVCEGWNVGSGVEGEMDGCVSLQVCDKPALFGGRSLCGCGQPEGVWSTRAICFVVHSYKCTGQRKKQLQQP